MASLPKAFVDNFNTFIDKSIGFLLIIVATAFIFVEAFYPGTMMLLIGLVTLFFIVLLPVVFLICCIFFMR
ncbi:MAG: hypothetical protein CSA11_12050 [Chloroflexi bacterium]|uniref:Uncharacterized protein n=1 Tax=candidate division KSB3 bacterium TaxID=2044937 RepID=A0A2G6E0U1_9BACT|nr:MAG: hypothetical protein CSB45_15210 [candidate division KSB3 bacterium]PIE79420.1 MAG: hypothetical protein CSA11_12050 [Chloroflexota bacterium]